MRKSIQAFGRQKGFKTNRDYQTDDAGAAHVELPKTFYILRLWASKEPFVTLFASWEQGELASGKEFPVEYIFRMETGVAAGGRVVDEQGKPIAGAKVQVMMCEADAKPTNSDGRAGYGSWLAAGEDAERRTPRAAGASTTSRTIRGQNWSCCFPSGLCVRCEVWEKSKKSPALRRQCCGKGRRP